MYLGIPLSDRLEIVALYSIPVCISSNTVYMYLKYYGICLFLSNLPSKSQPDELRYSQQNRKVNGNLP